jgi:hypothetical protein
MTAGRTKTTLLGILFELVWNLGLSPEDKLTPAYEAVMFLKRVLGEIEWSGQDLNGASNDQIGKFIYGGN